MHGPPPCDLPMGQILRLTTFERRLRRSAGSLVDHLRSTGSDQRVGDTNTQEMIGSTIRIPRIDCLSLVGAGMCGCNCGQRWRLKLAMP